MGIPYNGSDGFGGSSWRSPIPVAAIKILQDAAGADFPGYTATEKTIQSPHVILCITPKQRYGEYASQYKGEHYNTTFGGTAVF